MLQSVFTNARERLEQDGNLPSPAQSEEEDDPEDDDGDDDSPKKRGRGPDKRVNSPSTSSLNSVVRKNRDKTCFRESLVKNKTKSHNP